MAAHSRFPDSQGNQPGDDPGQHPQGVVSISNTADQQSGQRVLGPQQSWRVPPDNTPCQRADGVAGARNRGGQQV